MTASYVVTAEQGITHNGRFYQKDAQVQLDGRSAAYHMRHATVRPDETSARQGTIKKGGKNG